MTSNKIYSVELLRFLFMVVICLWHFRGIVPSVEHGYLAVEFYFILSGFLLYRSFKGGKYHNAIDYTIRKVKRFYLPVLIALVFSLVVCWRMWLTGNVVHDINHVLVESLMLHRSPMFGSGSINGPVWYVTVLLLSGLLLYRLLQQGWRLGLLFLTVTGYGWLIAHYKSVDCLFQSPDVGILLLLRGLSGMSLGALVAMLSDRLPMAARVSRWASALAFYCLGAFLYVCVWAADVRDEEAILLASILVLACFAETGWFNKTLSHRCFAPWGKLSLYMLVIHFPVCRVMEYHLAKHINYPPRNTR